MSIKNRVSILWEKTETRNRNPKRVVKGSAGSIKHKLFEIKELKRKITTKSRKQ